MATAGAAAAVAAEALAGVAGVVKVDELGKPGVAGSVTRFEAPALTPVLGMYVILCIIAVGKSEDAPGSGDDPLDPDGPQLASLN